MSLFLRDLLAAVRPYITAIIECRVMRRRAGSAAGRAAHGRHSGGLGHGLRMIVLRQQFLAPRLGSLQVTFFYMSEASNLFG